MGFSKSSAQREIHSNTSLSQETRETSNKQPNFTSKATRKKRKEESQSQQKERNHKNQDRNNEKETKETIAKIFKKSKSWFFDKINKIHNPLDRLIKKKVENNKINNI